MHAYLVIQFLNASTHPLLGSGCCAHEILCLFSQFLKLLRSQFVEDTLELAIQFLQVHVVSMEIYAVRVDCMAVALQYSTAMHCGVQ